MMTNLYLIADLAGSRVAIESGLVESVVHTPDIVAVPMCDPAIAGIFALRSRVLTLIDTQYLVTGVKQPPEKGALAVVTEIGGHQYGLLVEKVHDVVSIDLQEAETAIRPSPAWARYVDEIATYQGALVMILNTSALVSGQTALAE
ncbi:chemotaxis protein CheW [Sphingorhabdus sp.]|uniref:chemotaxis protein CheW n=1 Tax=Sphingorhabdus sp. TaxID=1902408 RepID=UPI0039830F19